MALFRLGKEREATTFTAENFKTAIRKYMEAFGFSQLTDSSIEGHPADMIFAAPVDRPWPREIWVESKASKLSLTDRPFLEEVRGYLNQWVSREPLSRFKLMIFVRQLVNPSRWQRIWGAELSREKVLEWLGSLPQKEGSPLLPAEKEIMSFIAETEVVEGDIRILESAAEAKNRVGLAALATRRQAQARLLLMEQREQPISKHSELIGNLVHIKVPQDYLVLQLKGNPRNIIENRGVPFVPYTFLSSNNLLTFDVKEPLDLLHDMIVSQKPISLKDVLGDYENKILELWNKALDRIVRAQEVRIWKEWYFFPLVKGDHKDITTASSKSLRVAKAYRPEDSRDPRLEDILSSDKQDQERSEAGSKRETSFVFHQAFAVRMRNIWQQPFVELRLRRLYTDDGLKVIDGANAARIDAKFRNSLFNRSETQLEKLLKLGEFLFLSPRLGDKHENWMSLFTFDKFIKIPTNWIPGAVSQDQSFLSDYEAEDGEVDE